MKTSKYEERIIQLLKGNDILFKREQTFEGLKGFKDFLRFDFVVYKRKDYSIDYFLEVNGIQHYKEIPFWGGKHGLQKRKEYDRKKMSYALNHNVPLICLPYWDIDDSLTYEKLITNPQYKVDSIWHNDKISVR